MGHAAAPRGILPWLPSAGCSSIVSACGRSDQTAARNCGSVQTSCAACSPFPRCRRCIWNLELLLEAGRRQAHRLGHVSQRIALGHPRVGVAEHVLDQPRVAGGAIQRRAVAVAEVVGAYAVNPDPGCGPDERASNSGGRERSDRAHGFQIGQRFGGRRTERNRPCAAALSRVDHERLHRPVPVLRTVAHQLAGSQPGEREDATADLRGGRRRPRLPLDHRAALIRHRRQDALDHVVGEAARFRRRARERLDVPHRVRRITTVEGPYSEQSA